MERPSAPVQLLRKASDWLVTAWRVQRLGVSGWRPCPHCGTAIVKNGGCPMMRCAECDGTFRWGRFHNTTKHVIAEHCPDPQPRATIGRAARPSGPVDALLREWMLRRSESPVHM